jgi:hypothetical protein
MGEIAVIRLAIVASVGAALGGLALLAPSEAKAWGKFGHLTVCDLAYRNLTPTSRQALAALLKSRSGGVTVPGQGQRPARHYTSFNMGCLEEDEMPRRNPADHFINLGRETVAITGPQCPPQASQGRCILEGIRRDLAILADPERSQQERVIALFAVGHWMGDIHQPLHVSFADDRGGNGIDAKVTGGCGKFGYSAKELHGVWDNCILHSGTFERVRRRADFKRSWSRFTVTYRAVDTFQANTTLAEEQQIVAGQPWQWAAESYRITTDPAVRYCVRAGSSCNYSPAVVTLRRNAPKRFEQLNQTYLQHFDRVAESRILYAGLRLGHLLNQALDPAYSGPVRNSSQPQ